MDLSKNIGDPLAHMPKGLASKIRSLDWYTVDIFEQRIAEFFGAPFAVAVDSCTHGLELCLRYKKFTHLVCPKHTYLSIPMLANKLNIPLSWNDSNWSEYYNLSCAVRDCATMWGKDKYHGFGFSCISFQHQKHLSLGRGGMILCDSKGSAEQLKKMSYDGRIPGIPWREQDVDTIGYHYYMTPETAQLGLSKLDAAITTPPRVWSWEDYPDISQFKVFKK